MVRLTNLTCTAMIREGTFMKKIRPAAAAGKFYTRDKKELLQQLEYFEKNNLCDYPNFSTRAIIVPHAGYIYSGQLSYSGFQYLDKNVKNVFIIAPSHYVAVKNVALSEFNAWGTPLGEIEVNQKINQEMIAKFGCEIQDDAFKEEHSAEVQVPFIQNFLPNVKIIPILTGRNIEKITEIISYYWENKENAFVISSDLSHFYPSKDARKIDHTTAELIETKDIENFESERACGAIGVCALTKFANQKGFSLIRVALYNSGDITDDNERVVGYGSWILYEGEKNKFIKKYFSDYVIDVCKKSIFARLHKEEFKPKEIPAVFAQSGATFVTLEKNGDLRGCIGSIIAHRPLIDDLAQNAQNSAFSDPRFTPLREDEFNDLEINVSILSSPEKMEFEDEADLRQQIRPNIDGLIIKDGLYQATYLPSVWEQLPDKVMFLNSLKIKAGLNPNHFSDSFEAYRYTTEYIREE